MKKNLLFLFIVLSSVAFGQAPNQINYQGIARNSVGNVLPIKNISVRLSVHDGTASGAIVYKEVRNVTTSPFGLFNIAIGGPGAITVSGSIGGINWGAGPKFLQVEIDPAGGSNFIDLGAAQLLSVPYALFSGNSTTASPTGTAGGDLTGTYPDPTIANDVITNLKLADNSVSTSKIQDASVTNIKLADASVTSTKLADNSVSTSKIVDGSVTSAKIAAGVIPTSLPPIGSITAGDLVGSSYPNPIVSKIQGVGVSTTGATTGQVLKFNGTNWAPGIDNAGSGSPTGPAGGDLSGTYPNPLVANGVITNSKLADNSVSTLKIQDAAVTTIKLADASVTNTKLADNSVSTPKIVDASITTPKIADGAVNYVKLATTGASSGQVMKFNGTNWAPGTDNAGGSPTGPAGGDLAGSTYPNPIIANGVINNSKLADNSVSTAKIQDAAVTTIKLGDASVTNTKLADNSVSTSKIQDAAVTTIKLADASVTNTKLADNSVSTTKILDGSVTSAKIAAGTSLPPNGSAGGDLGGSYPNPSLSKIQGVTVNTIGLVAGQVLKFDGTNWIPGTDNVGTGGSPTGPAGGDLFGTYPDPTIKNGAVTNVKIANGAVITPKIADAAVTTNKILDGAVTYPKLSTTGATTGQVLKYDGTNWAPGTDNVGSGGSPTGPAGGDLSGSSYPNPIIANGVVNNLKLADNSVSTSKIQDAAVTTIKLADASVTSTKLADNSVGTTKILDGSVTAVKLAASGATAGQVLKYDGTNWIPGTDNVGSGGSPTGPAGGDLSGSSYPNPIIANGVVDNLKLADNSVSTSKIQDGAVTTIKLADASVTNTKLADNSVSTSKIQDAAVTTIKLADASVNNTKLADNSISTSKIQDAAVANIKLANGSVTSAKLSLGSPSAGQVLKFDGTNWIPSTDNTGSFSVPYSSSVNSSSSLFFITNTGDGAALEGDNTSATANVSGIIGRITNTNPGVMSAAIKGVNSGIGTNGIGVYGTHAGNGYGVYGSSAGGTGVFGTSTSGFGLYGITTSGTGLYTESSTGSAAIFKIANTSNIMDAVAISNDGQGYGISVTNTGGGTGIDAKSETGIGINVVSQANHGLVATTNSTITGTFGYTGISGFNWGGGIGVLGVGASNSDPAIEGYNNGGTGPGIKGVNLADGGTAVEGELLGVTTGNIATFKVDGIMKARIDQAGTGHFLGGTTNTGVDVAETFDVEGDKNNYEPGDVLIISQSTDRKVEKSQTPYSTLVAGVYATKPGVLLTEKNTAANEFNDMVPMGVIGVIPTKVCLEGGIIKRGDMLVTSSIAGVAMKADIDKVKVGQVIGKALQDYNANGTGKINVLVSVK